MSESKKQTLMQGALILVVANLLVKIIGAAFKIPLANLIGEYGGGLFTLSYTIYTFMFVVSTAGFPVAVSKMVAQRVAVGKHREAERVFTSAIMLLSVVGLVGAIVLFFGRNILARVLGDPAAAWGIMAIAPAVFFVSLASALRGYFQGHRNMYPTAFSELIEAAAKLGVGYFLASFFIKQSVIKASAGAVFGVTCGTLLSFLLLLCFYVYRKRQNHIPKGEQAASYRPLLKELIRFAIPVTIGAAVSSLTNVIDMLTVMRSLQTVTQVTAEFQGKYGYLIDPAKFTGGIYEELATSLYGLYSMYAVPLFNMPLTLFTALAISIVPALTTALAKKQIDEARSMTQSVLKITVLFALPCAVGMSILAEPILMMLYRNPHATNLLQLLSVAILFVSLLSVTTAILQAYGHAVIPMVNMIIGGVIKIIINNILVATPSITIEGAPIGTIACYFTIVVMNFCWIAHYTGARYQLMGFFVKPLIAVAVMGGTVVFANQLFAPLVGDRLSCLPAIAVGGLVYIIILLPLRAMNRSDVELLPKGTSLAKVMEKFRLL